jgi:VWFA-related protein
MTKRAMLRIKGLLTTGLLALAPAVLAQEPAEMTSHEEPVTFRSRVNLVQVPVVVRDARGQAVGDLRKEDFRLTDRGKPQEITRFSMESHGKEAGAGPKAGAGEQAAGAAAPPSSSAPPERFVVFLFDDRHLEAQDLLMARAAAKRRLAEIMGPDVRAALFTTTGRGEVDFTDDQSALRQAIDAIVPQAHGVMASGCAETSYGIADRAFRGDPDAGKFLTLAVKACLPDASPTEVAATVGAMVRRALNLGQFDASMALNSVDRAIRRLAVMPGERRVVLVSAGFPATSSRPEEDAVMENAVRSKVVVGTLDARGLYAASMDTGQPPPGMSGTDYTTWASLKLSLDSAAASTQSEVLQELADGTGGIAFQNNNDLEAGFTKVTAAAEHVYVLGFAPQNLKHDGDFHPLKVTVNDRVYTVSARRGYYAPTQLADAADQAREDIREAVFSRDEIEDVPIDLRTQFFKPDEDTARLTTIARVDLKALRFRQADERNLDNLTIVTVVFDRDGKYVAGYTKDVSMRLKQATFERMMASGLSLRNTFNVTPGVYQVRLVVRDSEKQVMAARNAAIEIP